MYGLLTRLACRHGDRYLAWCLLSAAAFFTLIVTPVSGIVWTHIEELSVGQFVISALVTVPFQILTFASAVWLLRGRMRTVHAWVSGRREGLVPADVMVIANGMPLRLMGLIAIGGSLTAAPSGALATLVQTHRLEFGHFLLLFCGGFLSGWWGVVMLWAWYDMCFRVIVADASVAQGAPTPRLLPQPSMRLKLVIVLITPMLVAVVYASAIAQPPGEKLGGLVRLLGLTGAVSGAFILAMVPFTIAFLMDPVRELTRVTREVAGGDLTARSAVSSGDEMGTLSATFNTMVAGLQERDALRIHNSELVDELVESRARIVASADDARRRVERDLHDGAQQRLVVMRLHMGMLGRRLKRGGDASHAEILGLLDEVVADLDAALNELRDLAHGIYPAELDTAGLASALDALTAWSVIPVRVEAEGVGRFAPEIEGAVYFSCREAIQNAGKHAGPDALVTITLTESDGSLAFEVHDDGAGFDAETVVPGSAGLQNICDRIGAVGGTVTVSARPGVGTRIHGSIPIAGRPHQVDGAAVAVPISDDGRGAVPTSVR